MLAEIIGVGIALTEEGTLGQSAKLIERELEACGISVGGHCAVGDQVQRLRAAVAQALGRSDVVILLGGLGPGAGAITKETVCEGLGRRLVLHEDSLRRIKEAYARAGRQMPQQAAKLAMLPEQSIVFPGVRGITPGCALSAGSQFIIMIPEKPEEFVPMFQKSVVPYLAKFSDAAVVTRTVNVFGVGEAAAKASLGELMRSDNPAVAVYTKQGELQVRVTARASTKPQAMALLSPVVDQIKQLLGQAAYGVDKDNLQNTVAALLYQSKMTVSAGESSTGGLLAQMLTEAPGGAEIFAFGVSAASDRIKQESLKIPEKLLKKYHPVSEQVAVAMAYGAMTQGKSSIGIGIAGSNSARDADSKKMGLVYVAICDKDTVWVKKLVLPKTAQTDYIRYMACMNALDLVRLYIGALPQKFAGGNPLKTALTGKISAIMAAGDTVKSAKEGDDTAGKRRRKRPWYGAVLPVKGDSGSEVVRKLILILAVVVFIGSASYLLNFYTAAESNKKLTASLQDMYIEGMSEEDITNFEIPSDYPRGYQKKFANLYKINTDVAGWIKIDDTQVNYPVVQTTDNNFYLRRDFNKKNNKHGIPWLDFHSSTKEQSDGYVIYGHNMTDGQMFGELMKYKPSGGGLAFLQEHPIISFDDVYRDNDYKIVSVFITNVKEQYGPIFYYNSYIDFENDAQFNEYVNEITARSYYKSNIDIKPGDQFLTLSTCSYEFGPVSDDAHVRTVIVGRRVRAGEKNDGSDIVYQINPNPKLPEGFANGKSNAQIAAENAASASAAASVAASEQAVQSAASSLAAQSSSQESSYTEEQEELVYQISRVEGSIVEALQAVKSARKSAKQASEDAEDASNANDAQRAANRAIEAERNASSAYDQALNARDLAERLHNEYSSDSTEKAYRDAERAAETVRELYQETVEYYDLATYLASGLISQPSSSSQVQSSSSQVQSSSSQVQSSSSQAQSSSSQEQSSSSQTEPVPPAPTEPNPPVEPVPPPEDGTAGEGGAGVEGDQLSSVNAEVQGWQKEKLTITTGGKKVTRRADEIVAGVVMNEVGSSFSPEAIKAQAVAAYTYIKYQNQSGSFPYLNMKTPNTTVKNAVNEVSGKAVYYNGKYAFTPFFATSAGMTNASSEVWGGSYAYLVPVDSELDEQARNYEVSISYDASKAADLVDSVMGVDLYDYSHDPQDWFEIISYTDNDLYIEKIRVGNKTTTGRYLREQVFRLRSAAFDIDYSASNDQFIFTTYGYGHGVGMSQTGADLYAREMGWDYVDILTHYYPGTKVR